MTSKQFQQFAKELLLPIFIEALKEVKGTVASDVALELRNRHTDALLPQMDALISIKDIKTHLGRNGVPMAHSTFTKHFIDTKLLHYVDNPNDQRGKYVLATEWAKIQGKQPLRVIKIQRAA